jgi:hypothetical protein
MAEGALLCTVAYYILLQVTAASNVCSHVAMLLFQPADSRYPLPACLPASRSQRHASS